MTFKYEIFKCFINSLLLVIIKYEYNYLYNYIHIQFNFFLMDFFYSNFSIKLKKIGFKLIYKINIKYSFIPMIWYYKTYICFNIVFISKHVKRNA